MLSVKFIHDIEKDAWNIMRVITQDPEFDKNNKERPIYGLPEDLVNKARNESDKTKIKEIIDSFLEQKIEENGDLINQKTQAFQKEWDFINDFYFEKLSKILQINIPSDTQYTSYLTHAGSCPFHAGGRWFMVRISDKVIGTIVAHEIMHIELNRNYGFHFKNIGFPGDKYDTFREAITVLLNEEMSDILPRKDYGYKEHQDIRRKILEFWRNNNNFRDLIDKAEIIID